MKILERFPIYDEPTVIDVQGEVYQVGKNQAIIWVSLDETLYYRQQTSPRDRRRTASGVIENEPLVLRIESRPSGSADPYDGRGRDKLPGRDKVPGTAFARKTMELA